MIDFHLDGRRTSTDSTLAAHGPLAQDLRRWLDKARRAGLDDESVQALFASISRATWQQEHTA